jgi:hypothetical protein
LWPQIDERSTAAGRHRDVRGDTIGVEPYC